jgi:hypothetical protein
VGVRQTPIAMTDLTPGVAEMWGLASIVLLVLLSLIEILFPLNVFALVVMTPT